ncbi:hypothetical protein [Granulicella sp. L60]|uniref:hypothetical protein n=1 Tax=Granulicella sp. L60 TaxID=1641866 RepID=UPI00131C9086|nr:hypothetical protein [Granulicella sp. L60]
MQSNTTNGNGPRLEPLGLDQAKEPAWEEIPDHDRTSTKAQQTTGPVAQFATRANVEKLSGLGKNKMLLIGGGLLAAVMFFVMTMFLGKPSGKKTTAPGNAHTTQQSTSPKGSVTPLMDAVHSATQSNSSGQLSPDDINRTKTSTGGSPGNKFSATTQNVGPSGSTGTGNLGSVPSFADTQQHWEEPRPYGETSSASAPQTQQRNALKEPSLVFVRNLTQSSSSPSRAGTSEGATPVLDFAPGTRILAKLTTEISSAVQTPVIAEAQYTYAVGDRVVIPAGAKFIGHLEQADRSGLVSVKFDEIDLKDDDKEKIEALGIGLDLAPIKGIVSGKNTGRNFLVRTASGIGSVAAMIVGNNTSSSFSEDDLIRERIAENAGNAGDTELMNLAVTNKVVVSVPADTKIYVVFTRREQNTAALHPIDTKTP